MRRKRKQKKESGYHFGRSITRQFCVIIICLVAGTLVLCWFLNTTFLESYYSVMKQEQLVNGYDAIDAAAEKSQLDSKAFDLEFERICSNGNIAVLIINSDGSVVRTSATESSNMLEQFMDVLFGNSTANNRSEVKTTDNYGVLKIKDSRLQADYLVLWGTLSNGNLIMMRTALESIRESVDISNRFLTYIGILAILISALVVFFVTKRITKPVLQLAEISRKMSELDFTAKYQEKNKNSNEINLLGRHINQLSQTLETTISELKTANNELLLDNERKTKIDEMRKEFLSNVSHELKTPIALIQGYAEGLQECINDDEQSREFYCEVIMDEADKMNQMVKKLLTLNHLEFGNDNLDMHHFNLTELISGVIHSSSILMQQNQIQLEYNELQPVYVWADEFQMEEVVTNYLSNAIHHAAGEKIIRISTKDLGEAVRVSVFNTGNQIPEADVDKIWDKFYKVDKARTREYGGSGIGLSIVKAIMDAHHRSCGVINHPDGVEFWFELDHGNQ